MSRKYKELTGVELVKRFCVKVLSYGIKNGFNTDGVKIWLHPKLVQSLGLNDFLFVKYDGCEYKIPVVADKSIVETKLDNGRFQSDIRVGDPEWSIDLDKGEHWFNEI